MKDGNYGLQYNLKNGSISNRQCWLVVERRENWLRDLEREFIILGFPKIYMKKVMTFKEGDILFTYVASGFSCIADIRLVCSSKPKVDWSLEWDDLFPVRISTKPVIVIPQEYWVDIRSQIKMLDVTKGKKDWRQCFRHALKPLSKHDAKLLFKACHNAIKNIN